MASERFGRPKAHTNSLLATDVSVLTCFNCRRAFGAGPTSDGRFDIVDAGRFNIANADTELRNELPLLYGTATTTAVLVLLLYINMFNLVAIVLVEVTMPVTTAVVVLLLYINMFNLLAIVLVEVKVTGQMLIDNCQTHGFDKHIQVIRLDW